jgi:lysophospholipase L1-like esterase
VGDSETAAAGPASKRRSALKTALTVLVAMVFGLLLAEGALRIYGRMASETGRRLAARDPNGALFEPYGNYGYRPKPGRVEHFKNGTRSLFNAMGYRGPLVSLDKPPTTLRIVLLGGSTAAGFAVKEDETIDAYLRGLLAERLPAVCVEVVSLAVSGYDSYQDFERFRVDGARLAPDLVIIHSGINDVRHAGIPDLSAPPDHRTLLWESALVKQREEMTTGPSLWTRVKHYSYLARLPGYVSDLLRQRKDFTAIRGVTEPYPAAVDYFETNVENTITLADQIGSAVILSNPPSALSFRNQPSDPIEKSYWIRDAGTTEAYRERLALRMQEIVQRDSVAGRRIRYVSHRLAPSDFMDDAHLTASGNATVARNLAEAVATLITPTGAQRSGGTHSCPTP